MARHSAEGMTKNLWFAILQLILYQFVMPDIVNTMSALFLKLPFSRRYIFSLFLLRGDCDFLRIIIGVARF